ncbi:hypothetical protein IFM89_020157 [Coptis chinensis]|uniref:Uncharacterized protein n=1 Tax=Coptis chinensis TaxID=261450 RepID=A0A835LF07_9MAGN|nr:hypothetical protein IFM89_020157 [Coptis chinensis]
MSLEKRFSFSLRNDQKAIEERTRWKGGCLIYGMIFVCHISRFSSFRGRWLEYGKTWFWEYVGSHCDFFAILFSSFPDLQFRLANINIDNEVFGEALGLTGVVLGVFGLLYGGVWRIQMRKRYNLPPNNCCCGNPAVTDCAQWLFCCWCSLAQVLAHRGQA